jgi:hypothetical protein
MTDNTLEEAEILKDAVAKFRYDGLTVLEEKLGINLDDIVQNGMDDALKIVSDSIGSGVPLGIDPSSFIAERDAKAMMLALATFMRLSFLFDCLEETVAETPKAVAQIQKVNERTQMVASAIIDLCAGYANKMGYLKMPQVLVDRLASRTVKLYDEE